jgi:ATPase family associated with various cellular activities (AAA)
VTRVLEVLSAGRGETPAVPEAKFGRAEQGAEDERNASLDAMLQRLEQHPGYVIAATNHAEYLDPAIWRRFDIHITLELPGQSERERIFARYIAPFGMPKPALVAMGEALATASPALIRQLCENIKRQIVLGPKLKLPMSKGAVVERVITSCHPHPDLGKPRLWTLGAKDHALTLMPWPLPLAADVKDEVVAVETAPAGEVVKFEPRR